MERYLRVDEPDGTVSVAFNEEVKAVQVEISSTPPPDQPPIPHQILEVVSRTPSTGRMPWYSTDRIVRSTDGRKIIPLFLTFILLVAAIANVSIHRRVVDILNVILMSITLVAVAVDSLASRLFIITHALVLTFIIAYLITYMDHWGQVGYLFGSLFLCIFILRCTEMKDSESQ